MNKGIENLTAELNIAIKEQEAAFAQQKSIARAIGEAVEVKGQPLTELAAQFSAAQERVEKARQEVDRISERLQKTEAAVKFESYLRDEYLDHRIPEKQASAIYSHAYAEGHSYGESEVENIYSDLAPLFNEVFAAGVDAAK